MKALDVLNPNPRSTLSGRLIFQFIFRSKNMIFPSKKQSLNWVEIKFQRNIWGQLDVRTRMRASKSWNFDLEKPIKPIKMDSCVNFADHCMQGLTQQRRNNMQGEGQLQRCTAFSIRFHERLTCSPSLRMRPYSGRQN